MADAHVFDGVTAVAATEDGQQIAIEVSGPNGPAALFFPAAEVPRIVQSLLHGAADAAARRGQATHRSTKVHSMSVQIARGHPDRLLLLVGIQPGSPPVAYNAPTQLLLQVAQGLLQSMGASPSDEPPDVLQ